MKEDLIDEQLALLRICEEKFGKEEGEKFFRKVNAMTMQTIAQATKELKSEISLTRWIITIIGIAIAAIGLFIAIKG